MLNKKGEVIYVGKSHCLKKRVSSYFIRSFDFSPKVKRLVDEIASFTYITTESEAEALILEADLIKKYKPKYNTMLKYGVKYPYLCLTLSESFPRLLVTRVFKEDDGNQYFGPYTSVGKMRELLKFIERFYPLRSCSRLVKRDRPCINYYMGKCKAPCMGWVDEEEYGKMVESLSLFLGGKRAELMAKLLESMENLAKELKFEEAAKVRDQIRLLEKVFRQPRISLSYSEDYLETSLLKLKEALNLDVLPNVIEGIDVSNLYGREAVGVVVCFQGGIPFKKRYRRYKIKYVEGINDPGMIAEVVRRRYGKHSDEGIPDLILIDGGVSQVNSAKSVLDELGVNIPIIGLAKKEELVFFPGDSIPVKIPEDSPALHLLQRIRNEAHRFAVSYHRKLRERDLLKTILEEIPGVGKERMKKLLRAFKSLEGIRRASLLEIAKIDGIGEKLAFTIKTFLGRYFEINSNPDEDNTNDLSDSNPS
ncbi:MAG: excinuclease ABC subunit UvrC [Synergistetes bacterium]|nr:excinuclease ABC subunit UvrC [Synergistota bacterium]MCX8127417.1 excinuclease ABC subunit UvrC [Synergistota bacterium]MDW8192281.1 excinuclease ABC subunit UvrC [Synergistota bacterium]